MEIVTEQLGHTPPNSLLTDFYAQVKVALASEVVAVDGIVFGEICDNTIIVSAEMDPPGGWVDVALDLLTGAELWREMQRDSATLGASVVEP